MMPILHSPGVMMPGQFGPISRTAAPAAFFSREEGLRADHVVGRNAFGDARDDGDAGVGRLDDRVGRERRRHEDHRGVGARLPHRLGDRVEDRDALVRRPALARA